MSSSMEDINKKKQNEIEEPLLNKKYDEHVGAYENAGIWGKLTFGWLNPLLEAGRSEKIKLDKNIPLIPESETSNKASSLLQESLWKKQEDEAATTSLQRAIFDSVWRPLAMNAVFAGMNAIASYVSPLLMINFISFLTESREDSSSHQYGGMVLAFIFFFSKTVESVFGRQHSFGAQRIGVQVRAALMVLIYKRSFLMKYYGLSNGKITNLVNVDVEKIGDCFLTVHGFWLIPLQVIIALFLLHKNLGYAPSLTALVATLLVMVINNPLASRQKRLNSMIMEAKDTRIRTTSETLKNMRVLKFHSWDSAFMKKVFQRRQVESSWVKRSLYTQSAVAFLFWVSPTFVSVITFAACVLAKTQLTTGRVLSTLAVFQVLQDTIYKLPVVYTMFIQTKVSLGRIEEFLKEEEEKMLALSSSSSSSSSSPTTSTNSEEETVVIDMEEGEYAWEAIDRRNMTNPTIKISEKLEITKGYKVAICGPVGSGKSSLLHCILGEIPRVCGAGIKVYGSKAYVPQSAWIQTGTIRDNVLFGKEMDIGFYEDVLEGCALNEDIKMWDDGDLTVVGERGMNLSGGQKQRIQLARAVYNDSDVYFLDDPFSALDAHTGARVFKRCLKELLARKTVIYVTHQLEFLDSSDLVLVMKDGRIVQSGKYDNLIADDPNGELVKQIAAHRKSVNQVSPPPEHSLASTSRKRVQTEIIEENFQDHTSSCKLLKSCHGEEAETGRVKWQVYSTFITCAYKGALVPVVLLCHVLFQLLQIGSNYWIAWATEEEGKVTPKRLICIFALISGGSSIFLLGRAVVLSTIAIETGQRLFDNMMTSVFRAPISFFDRTPSSQILNRTSTDQSTIDVDLPYRLAGLVFALFQLVSIIFLMSQSAWFVSVLFLVIIAVSLWYQDYYITTARELARMVGIKKAVILHHFSETITGAATVRCFNQEDRFVTRIHCLIDDYSRINFHNFGTTEWLSVRIDFFFNLVFLLVLMILVSLPRSALHPSLAGLIVSYGLNINVVQSWVTSNLCSVQNKMISVERIIQFSKIPSEAPLIIEESRPIPEWPMNGTIVLENLHVKYNSALPMILKGITCTFPGQKKIGIVGRTGSGKSTLIQTLFRVVEPSEGRILVDGVDICKIGLQDLRSKLSIIPQDPTLFKGTMRTNLDPLEQHPDQEIWEVVSKCRLAEVVRQDQRLLDAPVAEDGENWSLGQKQLVCLARALLQKRRILVLDEATTSVDTATDNLLQRTIRESTRDCTVITVAHRLPTVIDNDFVLVLDKGKVIEYDSPTKLLEDNTSAFSKLKESSSTPPKEL